MSDCDSACGPDVPLPRLFAWQRGETFVIPINWETVLQSCGSDDDYTVTAAETTTVDKPSGADDLTLTTQKNLTMSWITVAIAADQPVGIYRHHHKVTTSAGETFIERFAVDVQEV